jgi:hypothetical protein
MSFSEALSKPSFSQFINPRAVMGGGGVYTGIRRMPTCQLFKVAYAHLQKVGARAYVHPDFCDRKAVYPLIFLAIHH